MVASAVVIFSCAFMVFITTLRFIYGDIEIKVDAIYITPFHDLYDYVLESAKNNNYSF